MSRAVKELIHRDLRDRYAAVDGACVVELTGMDVPSQQQLRGALREKSARLEVVKNRLMRVALKDCPLEPLAAALTGPCALVTTSASLIDVAKTLVAAAAEFTGLKLKDAMFAGDPSLVSVESLSKMKGMAELLGEIAMLVSSPGRSIAGCLQSPQGKIAGCLKTMADKAA